MYPRYNKHGRELTFVSILVVTEMITDKLVVLRREGVVGLISSRGG